MAINLSKVREDDVFRFVIRPGDTLESLSALLEVEIGLLLAVNPQVSSDGILPGMELIIPSHPTVASRSDAGDEQGAPTADPATAPEGEEAPAPAPSPPAAEQHFGSAVERASAPEGVESFPPAARETADHHAFSAPEAIAPSVDPIPEQGTVESAAPTTGPLPEDGEEPPARTAGPLPEHRVEEPPAAAPKEARQSTRPLRSPAVEWRPFPKI